MWFVKNCCGCICVLVTYCILAYIDALVCTIEIVNSNALYQVQICIFNFVIFMVIWAHFRCAFTNPGAVPKGYKQLDQDQLPLKLNYMLEKAMSQPQSDSHQNNLLLDTPNLDPMTSITTTNNELSNNEKLKKNELDSHLEIIEEKIMLDTLLNGCRSCNSLKPPKTHHCSICKR